MSEDPGGGDPPHSNPIPSHITFYEDPFDDPLNNKVLFLRDIDKIRYSNHQYGPYYVSLRSKNGNLGNAHPMLIGKDMIDNNIKGIKRITKVNNEIVNLEFESPTEANKLLDTVEDKLLNRYIISVPLSKISKRVIIKDVEPTIPLNSLCKTIDKNSIRTISLRRIFKKENGELVPTYNLDALLECQIIPQYYYLLFHRCKVESYKYPVLQCTNCLMFGHRAEIKGIKVCKNAQRCLNCGDKTHNESNCKENTKCINCSQAHKTTDNTCPKYLEEKLIKEIMATEHTSYRKAQDRIKNNVTNQITPENYSKTKAKLTQNHKENEVPQKKDFPTLHNKYHNLDIETTEVLYSNNDLNKSYANTTNPTSPRRKIPRKSLTDKADEIPSQEWIEKNIKHPHNEQKSSNATKKEEKVPAPTNINNKEEQHSNNLLSDTETEMLTDQTLSVVLPSDDELEMDAEDIIPSSQPKLTSNQINDIIVGPSTSSITVPKIKSKNSQKTAQPPLNSKIITKKNPITKPLHTKQTMNINPNTAKQFLKANGDSNITISPKNKL